MRLENDYYAIEIEPTHGRLVRLFDKAGKLELTTEPRLSENFRLLQPIPGMHANYILGTEQPLTASEESGGCAKLTWAGPLVNERGRYNPGLSLAENIAGACKVYQPFEPLREAPFPTSLTIAAERVKFVVEQ